MVLYIPPFLTQVYAAMYDRDVSFPPRERLATVAFRRVDHLFVNDLGEVLFFALIIPFPYFPQRPGFNLWNVDVNQGIVFQPQFTSLLQANDSTP